VGRATGADPNLAVGRDPQQSLRFLQSHQDYKHIKRMVLELEGHEHEAAGMQ